MHSLFLLGSNVLDFFLSNFKALEITLIVETTSVLLKLDGYVTVVQQQSWYVRTVASLICKKLCIFRPLLYTLCVCIFVIISLQELYFAFLFPKEKFVEQFGSREVLELFEASVGNPVS